jgi:hypothetical protein
MANSRLAFVWDYDINEEQFRDLLSGRQSLGSLDRDWAAVRLLEHASYRQVLAFLNLGELVRGWPAWRSRVRSVTRRRGFDFLVEWLSRERVDLL